MEKSPFLIGKLWKITIFNIFNGITMERSTMLLSSVKHIFRTGPSLPWLC
jgi:hypothetical protein